MILNLRSHYILTCRPPIYCQRGNPLAFLGPWGILWLPGTRDDHVVQSRDCRITIATQYQTSHQQILTWIQCCETSLGGCPFIFEPANSCVWPASQEMERWHVHWDFQDPPDRIGTGRSPGSSEPPQLTYRSLLGSFEGWLEPRALVVISPHCLAPSPSAVPEISRPDTPLSRRQA